MKTKFLVLKIVVGIFVLILCLGYFLRPSHLQPISNTSNVLAPEQVFDVSASESNNSIHLLFGISPGYYIYKDRLKITTTPADAINLNTVKWPHTLDIPDINDESKTDTVFTGNFGIDIPMVAGMRVSKLEVILQGCNGKSICYPPQSYSFDLTSSVPKPASVNAPATFTQNFMQFYHGEITGQALLNSLNMLQLLVIFFMAGIAIALTPCMYPLYPIALATIMGNATLKRKDITLLVVVYIHGMAVVYVLMGFFAAYTGRLMTTLIQTPLVMLLSGAIWFILGLSMFGIFEIKLPHRLNSYLHNKSMSIDGGKHTRVFAMGVLSSILLGPCVTPPLIAAIGFIVGRADVLFGGIGLYAISLGMGVPILILALVGGKLLPRSGRWMIWVKCAMGALMIAGSLYLVAPFMYNYYFAKPQVTNQGSSGEINVETSTQLDSVIAYSERPVIIDFYANWCTVCVEMAKETFPDKGVQQLLKNYKFIKFDLSKNTPDQLSVLHRYGLYGPPAILFLDKTKQVQNKLLGFTSSTDLIKHLKMESQH